MAETQASRGYPLDPVLDFLRLLWAVEHGLQRASKGMEASLGITGPQRLVLRIVGRFPGLSAGDLAQILQLHKSTITGIVQRLVARGLLSRELDSTDKRRVRLQLKATASRFTRTSQGTVERAVTQALSGARSSRVRAARSVLADVANALHQANERDPLMATRRRRPKRQSPDARLPPVT